MTTNGQWFREARYGLFIHYGLYSLLGRGEWVMNREGIPTEEYARLRERFTAEKFDADDIIRRARDWGMRYAVLTTKHHEGFCLFDSKLTDFTAPRSPAKRDLVAEFVSACRKHGLRIGIYCSLNDWHVVPGSVDALERPAECYDRYLEYVHGQVRELMTNYGQVDVMWYDGWWPFGPAGWQAEKLNAMVRQLQPGILVNGRTGLAGDFKTPEGHIQHYREPWEACLTTNESWGYHAGDHEWKSPAQVAEMLRTCAAGQGNLLLNVGPKGDGSLPTEAVVLLDRVGKWLSAHAEAIYRTDRFTYSLRERGDGRAEFLHHGSFTAAGNNLYLHIRHWPGPVLHLPGVKCTVTGVQRLEDGRTFPFVQQGERVTVTGLPEQADMTVPVVLRFTTKEPPMLYLTAGVREPKVPHPHYDPAESDIQAP